MSITKKIVTGLALLVLFIFCVFTLVPASFLFKKIEIDHNDAVAGLIACLSSNSCKVPVTIQDFKGVKVIGTYLKMPENGINVKYSIIDGGFNIIVVEDDENQTSLTDVDLDGFVDAAFVTENGITHTIGDPGYSETATEAQILYMSALTRAWERVIPEDIKKALLENPEKSEKEEVPAKKPPVSSKYAT